MKKGRIVGAHEPADYEPHIIGAIKALASGNANESQQKNALAWIINEAAKTYDQPFRPGADGDRDTAFACGRMFVGQQIVKVMKLTIKENA